MNISLFIFSSSCGILHSSKSVDVNEYAHYYQNESESYSASLNVNSIEFEIKYVPYELQVSQRLRAGDLTIEEAKEFQKSFSSEHTFQLRVFLPTAGKDIYNYNLKKNFSKEDRINYYLNALKNDVSVITSSNDTIRCTQSLLEQGISNMNVATFLFDFSQVERSELQTFVFKDRILSESDITFDLKSMNLMQIPKLSFKGYEK